MPSVPTRLPLPATLKGHIFTLVVEIWEDSTAVNFNAIFFAPLVNKDPIGCWGDWGLKIADKLQLSGFRRNWEGGTGWVGWELWWGVRFVRGRHFVKEKEKRRNDDFGGRKRQQRCSFYGVWLYFMKLAPFIPFHYLFFFLSVFFSFVILTFSVDCFLSHWVLSFMEKLASRFFAR